LGILFSDDLAKAFGEKGASRFDEVFERCKFQPDVRGQQVGNTVDFFSATHSASG